MTGTPSEPDDVEPDDVEPDDVEPDDVEPDDVEQPDTARPHVERRDVPVIPERSADDSDVGWERSDDSDDERYLRDRPPHWE